MNFPSFKAEPGKAVAGVLIVAGIVFFGAEMVAGLQAKGTNATLPDWFLKSFGKVENVSPGPLGAGGNLLLAGVVLWLLVKYV